MPCLAGLQVAAALLGSWLDSGNCVCVTMQVVNIADMSCGQGEIFAAEGYAKVTGDVGVCIATSGPGATNLVTGLADALLDSVPLVAITGQVRTSAFVGPHSCSPSPHVALLQACRLGAAAATCHCCPAGAAAHDWHRRLPGDPHRGGHTADHQAQLPGHGHRRPATCHEGGAQIHHSSSVSSKTVSALTAYTVCPSLLMTWCFGDVNASTCCRSLQAFYLAKSGRPGPVLVDVPKDIQQQLAMPDFEQPMAIDGYISRLPQDPVPEQVDAVIQALREVSSLRCAPGVWQHHQGLLRAKHICLELGLSFGTAASSFGHGLPCHAIKLQPASQSNQ